MMPISKIMTPCPHRIPAGSTAQQADEMMRLNKVSYLLVVAADELAGVLPERSVKLFCSLGQAFHFSPPVETFCEKEPCIVPGDMRVGDVADAMATQRLDYVLVADENENVIGIFTTAEACRYIHLVESKLRAG